MDREDGVNSFWCLLRQQQDNVMEETWSNGMLAAVGEDKAPSPSLGTMDDMDSIKAAPLPQTLSKEQDKYSE